MILVDPMELYLWFALFFVTGVAFVIILLFLIAPKQIWTFIKARALKRALIKKEYDDGAVSYTTAKMLPEGQLKISKNEYRMVPSGANPIVANRSFLKGYGIPYFDCYDGLMLAVSPQTLAAIRVADIIPQEERKKLPKGVLEWAKATKVPVETKRGGKVVGVRKKPLFTTTALQLKDYFAGVLSRSQFEVLLEKREMLGEKKAGKPVLAAGIAITGILGMVIIGVMLLLPLLG